MVDQKYLLVNIISFSNSFTATETRHSRAKTPTDEMPFRSTVLIHKKRNSQGTDRKSGIKRLKMLYKDEICKFNFKIMYNEYGYIFSITHNGGNHIHNSHRIPHDPSNIPVSTQFLDEEEEETVQYVVGSACNKATGRNYMFCRWGKFVSSMKVAYLNCKENKSISEEHDIDFMLADFQKSFTALYNNPKDDFLVILTSWVMSMMMER